MGNAIEKLTGLVKAEHRYDIPFAELRDTQIEAMNERFQARKDAIKLLGHRAGEAKIDTIRSHAEAVPLLLPHTAYKSYPESWLMDERRSEEHTSELQSLMRISYAVFCLKTTI